MLYLAQRHNPPDHFRFLLYQQFYTYHGELPVYSDMYQSQSSGEDVIATSSNFNTGELPIVVTRPRPLVLPPVNSVEVELNPCAEAFNYYKNQIHVRGLPHWMTDAHLYQVFHPRYGAGVVNVKVWVNKHGISIPCGHVTFASPSLVEDAVELGELEGIKIERHMPQSPKTVLRTLSVSPEDPNAQLYVAQVETELECLREVYVERKKIPMLAETLHRNLFRNPISYSLF